MSKQIVIREYNSAAQINRFVKGRSIKLSEIKEELNLIFNQAVFFTAAPHNDLTALNTVFTAFNGASKQLTSTQKTMLEFVKFHAGAFVVFDSDNKETPFRFKTVRVKGKSKSISEEKRVFSAEFEKMGDYRNWLHPDIIAANNAANSVIQADSLQPEPFSYAGDEKPDVPKNGAGKGKEVKPLTKARLDSFKKAALVTLKMKAKKEAEKEAQADLLNLIAFLAKEAGLITANSGGVKVADSETVELTSAEEAADTLANAK